MTQFLRITGALLLVLAAASIWAAPPAKEIVCRSCHGEAGGKTLLPGYPKLNGQNQEYLTQVLLAYQKGERKGGLAQIMTAQTANLSKAEIVELAKYYSKQP